jgi:protein-tyrosine phosphatase
MLPRPADLATGQRYRHPVHTAVTAVMVTGDGADHLVVAWELEGPDRGVDVAVGPQPDRIDHSQPVTVPAGQSSLRLDRPASTRVFVSVSPAGSGSGLVVAERRVPLEGAVNFRDLGGYLTTDGRWTRWGCVFRSDAFHALTNADQVRFAELGLRVVYDLRSERERAALPNLMPDDGAVRSIQLDLSAGHDESGALPPLEQLREGAGFVMELYRGMVSNGAPVFGTLLSGLAEPGGLPAVFHCLWGKDRTGVAAAVLLSALGVPDEDVIGDYVLTQQYRSQQDVETALANLHGAGVPPEAAAGVVGTPGWVVGALLAELRQRYGSIDDYLLGPAGMARSSLAELRRLLLTD